MDRAKVTQSAQAIVLMLAHRKFSADENLALLKTLDKVLQTKCFEKDLVVAPLKMIKEVCEGRAPIESLIPK